MRFKEKPVKAGLGLAWAGSYKTDSILYRRIELYVGMSNVG